MRGSGRLLAALMACVPLSAGASSGACLQVKGKAVQCGYTSIAKCVGDATARKTVCIPEKIYTDDFKSMLAGGEVCSFTLGGIVRCGWIDVDSCIDAMVKDRCMACFLNPLGDL